MRPIIQTVVAGGSLQIPLDLYQRPFDVMIDIIVNGAGTYTVQASNDDPFSGSAPTNFVTSGANGVVLPAAASTAAAQGSITGNPVRQLYFTVSAGSATIRVVQAGAV
jgi:hypothetical protein